MATDDDMIRKVAALGDLTREELASLWRQNFGTAPPKGVHRELLVRGAAYHLQLKHRGGLPGETRRLLNAAMRQIRKTMIPRQDGTSASDDQLGPEDDSRKTASAGRSGNCDPSGGTGQPDTENADRRNVRTGDTGTCHDTGSSDDPREMNGPTGAGVSVPHVASPSAVRRSGRTATGSSSSSSSPPVPLRITRAALPGARLIREWNGRPHVVDVVQNGFIYNGTRYRSLSRIAREITGTQWSGPRFFGL